MEELPLKCLLGLECNATVDALRVTGQYVRWIEILSFAVFVMAISEFIDRNLFHSYILKRSKIVKPLFIALSFSILAVVVANILTIPLIPGTPIPFISYPTFWELLSLLAATFVLVVMIPISFFPKKFIPKFNKRNYRDVWNIACKAILYDGTTEAYFAFSRVIDYNLERIIKYAKKYDSHYKPGPAKSAYERYKVKEKDKPIIEHAIRILDQMCSDEKFCKYLACNNIRLVSRLIGLANENQLWTSCGYSLYQTLYKNLFENDESILSQELSYGGLGYSRPLFSSIFNFPALTSNYNIFQPCTHGALKNISSLTIRKVCDALEIAIIDYFSNEQINWHKDCPASALKVGLTSLTSIIGTICRELNYDKVEFYRSPYQDLTIQILMLFETISKLLPPKLDNLSDDEKNITIKSLGNGIVDSVFQILESLSLIQNNQTSRAYTTNLFWILFSYKEGEYLDVLHDKLYEKISKRIDENKKKNYVSMSRLMLSVYGSSFPNAQEKEGKIASYIQDEFYKEIAQLGLANDESAEYFFPSNWSWDIIKKEIKNHRNQTIYPMPPIKK
ncbi:hypothetical protein K1X76_08720 [bacterium]|nr:hypothetical protein [bacterium]